MSNLNQKQINNAIRQAVFMAFVQGHITEDDLRQILHNNKEVLNYGM
jgi:hypothetical protein